MKRIALFLTAAILFVAAQSYALTGTYTSTGLYMATPNEPNVGATVDLNFAAQDELAYGWAMNNWTPTYVSSTSYTVAGDKTATLTAGRRIKATVAGGTVYGTIASATYSAPNTTVTISEAVLTNPITAVEFATTDANSASHTITDDGVFNLFTIVGYRPSGGNFASITFKGANGSQASPSKVLANQQIGGFSIQSYTDAGWDSAARTFFAIYAGSVDWTDSTSNMPFYFKIRTRPIGTTTPADRLTIDQNGLVGINTTAPKSTLHVAGSMAGNTNAQTGISYTLTDTDYLITYNNASAITVTLLACDATRTGRDHVMGNLGTGTVTVNRASADTFVGNGSAAATSFTMTTGKTSRITCDGAGHWLLLLY